MRKWLTALLVIWALLITAAALRPFAFEWRCMICPNGAVIRAGAPLQFQGPGLVRAEMPERILSRVIESRALAIDMTLTPASTDQYGPARILSWSADPYRRNVMIAQDGAALVLRLRMAAEDPNGHRGEIRVPDVFRAGQDVTIALRHDGQGTSVAIDGAVRAQTALGAVDFTTWAPNFDLILGNEATGDRPWQGSIARIEIRAGTDASGQAEAPILADMDFTATTPNAIPGVLSPRDLSRPDHYLGFGPLSTFRDSQFLPSDLLLQFLLFLPLGLIARHLASAAPPNGASFTGGRMIAVLAGLVGFALALELLQAFAMGGRASGLDLIGALLGGLAGLGLAHRTGPLARWLGAAFMLWAVGFLSLWAVSVLWRDGAPPPARADAIICLGADMSLAGWDRPGPASARRAQTCADLYKADVAPVILFTGYGHEILSAAEAMARLAAGAGVPETAIRIEPTARSTLQNAAFSLALLPPQMDRIILVSDAFHLPRSWLIFRMLGAPETALYAARMSDTPEDRPQARTSLNWVLRESVVIWVNLGRAAMYYLGGLAGIDADTRIGWFN